MPAPDKNAWLFAIKTCIAALTTLYIALDLSLDRPSWAVTTVFIASQLYAGATVSKSVYRLLGTCLGAIASVAMVPNLVQTPELLCVALAGWVAACLFISLLDRSPRSYVFMLAGYSAAFICFPAIKLPLSIFDLSVARVEEISLGVICSSLVHTLVLPRFVQSLIDQKIDSWLDDARQWWVSLVASPDANAPKSDQALIAKLSGYPPLLEAMATHLAYENAGRSKAERTVHHLVTCQSLLLPLIASIELRLDIAERQRLAMPANVKVLIDAVSSSITATEPTRDLRSTRQVISQMAGTAKGWEALFWQSLALKIEELLTVLSSVHELRSVLRTRFELTEPSVPRQSHRPQLDLGLAALSALTAFCSILAGCALWIGTGWEDGASVPMIAAVACSFFGALDTPIPSMKVFLRYALVSVAVTLVYTAVLLPLAGSFEMVALFLAPALIILGLLMANPSTAFIGMVLSTNIATLVALDNRYSGDFIATLNGSLATVCGLVSTMAVMSLLRARTPTWRGHRIKISALKDLHDCLSLDVGNDHFHQVRTAFVHRMVDRLHQIIPRLGTDETLEGYLLGELRLGANILDLRHSESERTHSDAAITTLVTDVIAGVGGYISSKKTRPDLPPSQALQTLLDRALVACQHDNGVSRRSLQYIINIRLVLFPDTSPGID